jgi:hypothetical protein
LSDAHIGFTASMEAYLAMTSKIGSRLGEIYRKSPAEPRWNMYAKIAANSPTERALRFLSRVLDAATNVERPRGFTMLAQKKHTLTVTRRKCCHQLKQNTGEILEARVGFAPAPCIEDT